MKFMIFPFNKLWITSIKIFSYYFFCKYYSNIRIVIGYFDFKVFDIRIIHKVGYLETLVVSLIYLFIKIYIKHLTMLLLNYKETISVIVLTILDWWEIFTKYIYLYLININYNYCYKLYHIYHIKHQKNYIY